MNPEFSIGNRRVDYALIRDPFGSVVLIEVKDVGKLTARGEEQLFDYCSKQGVPLAVLTDGRSWNFYSPAGMGSYEQRRFAGTNLVNDNETQCARILMRYLGFGAVTSGQSHRDAQSDYDSHQQQIVARQQFGPVMQSLVAEADPRVVAVFGDEVEKRCGTRPDEVEIGRYLRTQFTQLAAPEPNPGLSPTSPQSGLTPGQKAAQTRRMRQAAAQQGLAPSERAESPSLVFFGQTRTFRTNHDLVFAVFQELASRDPTFCEKCSPLVRQLRRRREDFGKSSAVPRELPGGWWINVWGNAPHQRDRIQKACEVAGIEYGRDITVTLRGKGRKSH